MAGLHAEAAADQDYSIPKGGASTDPVAVGAPPDPVEQGPTAHYRQAEEHAADVLDFTPGERVSMPFSPRADDEWEVDGRSPRALPAGHASGPQMRDTPDGKAWALGIPHDVAAPLHFGLRDGHLDLEPPTGGGTAPSVSAILARAALPPEASSVEAAQVGSNGLRREVFGFLPYWELGDDATVLDWRTLSTLAYFSVGCRSDGGLLKRNLDGSLTTGWAGWTSSKMTSIINAAHSHRTTRYHTQGGLS